MYLTMGGWLTWLWWSAGFNIVDTGRSEGKGNGQNTQKTVAIVVGGLVGSGLFIACLLVLKRAFKKKREVTKY